MSLSSLSLSLSSLSLSLSSLSLSLSSLSLSLSSLSLSLSSLPSSLLLLLSLLSPLSLSLSSLSLSTSLSLSSLPGSLSSSSSLSSSLLSKIINTIITAIVVVTINNRKSWLSYCVLTFFFLICGTRSMTCGGALRLGIQSDNQSRYTTNIGPVGSETRISFGINLFDRQTSKGTHKRARPTRTHCQGHGVSVELCIVLSVKRAY